MTVLPWFSVDLHHLGSAHGLKKFFWFAQLMHVYRDSVWRIQKSSKLELWRVNTSAHNQFPHVLTPQRCLASGNNFKNFSDLAKANKVYVTDGGSPDGAAKDQVYVYDINTDQWGQLPPPGQYFSVPQIIGDKLAILVDETKNQ